MDDALRLAQRNMQQDPSPENQQRLTALTQRAGGKTRVSASQLETFDGSRESCYRKWAFGSVWKLPQAGDNSAQNFGTVLHGVVERYLKADELGRDASGNAVNLYPEGWYIPEDRWGRKGEPLEEKDRQLVQVLVERGIQEGVIQRHLQRKIEHPSDFIVPELQDVQVNGYIDFFAPNRIEDHKTTGNLRYTKSAEALKTNTQMMVYGKYLLLAHQDVFGVPYSNNIVLRHNIFLKDAENPQVIGRETLVSPEHIESEWLTLVPRIAKMRDQRAKLFGVSSEAWETVEAQNVPSSCRAFGGCPYQTICGKSEKPSEYIHRVNQFNLNKNKTIDSLVTATRLPVVSGGQVVNFFEMVKSQGIQPTTTATQPIPNAPQYVPPVAQPIAQPVAQAAPPLQQAVAQASQPASQNPFAALIGVGATAPAAPVSQPIAQQIVQQAAPVAQQVVVSPVAPVAVAEPPKKKRGRPSKADLAARAAAQQSTPQVAPQNNEEDDEGEEEVDEETLPTAFSFSAPQPAQPIASSQNPSPNGEIQRVPPTPTPAAQNISPLQPAASTSTPASTSNVVTSGSGTQTVTQTGGILFWLFEGCNPQKTPPGARIVYTSELLRQIAIQMSQDAGKNYYDIDDFTRRNFLLKAADGIVAAYLRSGDLVVSDIDNPDNSAIVTAIKPFAVMTIRGTR